MIRETRNTTIILVLVNMKHLSQRESLSQLVRNSKSAHQKICLVLETTTRRARSKKVPSTPFMAEEMISTMTIPVLANTRPHNNKPRESKWERS